MDSSEPAAMLYRGSPVFTGERKKGPEMTDTATIAHLKILKMVDDREIVTVKANRLINGNAK